MSSSAPSATALTWLRTGDLRALIDADGKPLVAAPAQATLRHKTEDHEVIGILTEGWACHSVLLADGRNQILDVLIPGDAFGLGEILGGDRSGTISAVTALRYRPFQTDGLIQCLAARRRAALLFTGYLLRMHERRSLHALMLGRFSARERIARFLVEIHTRLAERRLADGPVFPLPLTQTQIGDHLALTSVHVNRVLRRLRDDGVVTVRERYVRALDWAALRRIALLPTQR